MTFKIAILGSDGQMGRAASASLEASPTPFEIHLFGRDLDICDAERLGQTLTALRPNIVLNCAAFTAVDACEADAARAFAANGTAVETVAKLCQILGACLIHLSTDYVFGDDAIPPLTEATPAAPINIYGKSKTAGEVAIRAILPAHIILRTSWIYGPDAGNFFATMMALGATREVVKVVEDEVSSPTLATDLADCILAVCQRITAGTPVFGTFHVSGVEGISRYDFARAIMVARKDAGLPFARVEPTTQAQFGAAARRPRDSRMDCTAFAKAYKTVPRGLSLCLPSLVSQLASKLPLGVKV